MVYFNHVVLILKTHKYPRIFCVTQNFLESCDRRSQHYEDIVASEIFSFRFVLCSVWLCLGVHRLYTSKFLCHYPVLLLASVSGFLPLCTPFCIDYTFILSIYRYFILLPKYLKARISIFSTWVIITFNVKNKLCI